MIPQKIIDNSSVTLATFLNDVLKEVPNTQLDIATAFFNIQAYAFIKDHTCSFLQPRRLITPSGTFTGR
jgi:hypothetical protein